MLRLYSLPSTNTSCVELPIFGVDPVTDLRISTPSEPLRVLHAQWPVRSSAAGPRRDGARRGLDPGGVSVAPARGRACTARDGPRGPRWGGLLIRSVAVAWYTMFRKLQTEVLGRWWFLVALA